jgi:hypothetical protein
MRRAARDGAESEATVLGRRPALIHTATHGLRAAARHPGSMGANENVPDDSTEIPRPSPARR